MQIYSDVMKTIQCAHPPHHHNGFVATCRLWTASGGVHALLVLEPTLFVLINAYIYILFGGGGDRQNSKSLLTLKMQSNSFQIKKTTENFFLELSQ